MTKCSKRQQADGAHSSLYVYDRLEGSHIRVLTLLPGEQGSHLQATLETVSIQRAKTDSAHKYEAVSYAWGSPILSRSLQTPKGRIAIPRSLYIALQHLRYPDHPRRLWADCICISQTDGEERNEQVAMMPSIFGSALKVLVWLGPSQPDDALAFALLGYEHRLPHWLHGVDDPIAFLDQVLKEQPWCACCRIGFSVGSHPALPAMIAAKRLLQRAWFARVWTLQEVSGLLERVTIHSGSHTASLESLRNSFHRIHDVQRRTERRYVTSSEFDTVALLHEVTDVYLADQFLKDPEDLISLMIRLSQRNCYDSRDRVFAIRGLLGIQDVPSLRPDYNLNAAHVYRQLVSHILRTSHERNSQSGEDRSLHAAAILGLCRNSSHEYRGDDQAWPSWVPDFHTLSSQADRRRKLYMSTSYMEIGCRPELWPFSRSSRRFLAIPVDEDSCILRVKGRMFGTIQSILEHSSCPKSFVDWENTASSYVAFNEEAMLKLFKWHQAICTFIQPHLDGMDAHSRECDDLVRLFLSCGAESGETAREKLRAARLLRSCLRSMSHMERQIDANRLQYRLAPAMSRNYVRYALFGRVAAVMSIHGVKTRLAWVPANTLVGDNVGICPGAPFPFVFRASRESMYQLRGDCWTLEVTEAEAVGAPHDIAEAYEAVGGHHKSLSKWWTGTIPDAEDFTGCDSPNEAKVMQWEQDNVGSILLC